jgi:hypothetical protein
MRESQNLLTYIRLSTLEAMISLVAVECTSPYEVSTCHTLFICIVRAVTSSLALELIVKDVAQSATYQYPHASIAFLLRFQ